MSIPFYKMNSREEYEMNEDCGWTEEPPRLPRRKIRNNEYSNAFGNYNGGYWSDDQGPGPFDHPPRPPPNFMFGPGPGPMFGPLPNQNPFGRGFGPDGPAMRRPNRVERVKRYLMRCGLTKDSLKNIPREILHKIEPEYCGVCALELDSFGMSRLHYLSKNHAKNLRKWVSKSNDGGSNQKEIPLKSRELYGELCDVHITSKSHADSHYAGRPHRAGVEGRKKPKNTILCQKSMEGRLEQLIRREKKNLKPIEEIQENEDEKEAKPISPELYCEICKTSMTCSEQMTMHLNGKRHLTKEKQHILKMMKCGSENEKKQKAPVKQEKTEKSNDETAADCIIVANKAIDVDTAIDLLTQAIDEEDVAEITDEGSKTAEVSKTADDENNANNAKEGEGEGDHGDAGNAEEPKEGEDDYDWGNGSGNWEDAPGEEL
ncbi:double-stranded RNA-binding zinc finger protein JAZ [Bombyx mori]|uniref:Double-stranded RNA-binding zinc finger protein JAZ n=1 Tax=Bombyx mori TaxID=7091 RepID=Q2F5Z3_BOMMO|nr:double-stranded RNA-binding zinc finger protein JAZ [Bombyx mori]ABD36224.1 double-stranded RNA-binding zinc finger protein JAZ [Bombyx mori]